MNRVRNITLFEAAVWHQSGTVRLDPGPNPFVPRVAKGGSLEVDAVSIDELIDDKRAPLPDVIKMDIEGGELNALRGAIKTLTGSRPTIFLATHGAVIHRGCCDLLSRLGYSLEPLLRGVTLEQTDEIIAHKRAV